MATNKCLYKEVLILDTLSPYSLSDDGKCITYTDGTSLCNPADDCGLWRAMFEAKFGRWRPPTQEQLDRFRETAEYAHNYCTPKGCCDSEDIICKETTKMQKNMQYAMGSIFESAAFPWFAGGLFIVNVAWFVAFLNDLRKDVSIIKQSYQKMEDKPVSINCKYSTQNIRHACDNLAITPAAGGLLFASCDGKELQCESIEFAKSK